ncbi:MAG: peptidylprolyl isomerase [Parvularculaceae bacterium]|nr:peptidylprolyl isomerase [Parvularculaceae bacterium]
MEKKFRGFPIALLLAAVAGCGAETRSAPDPRADETPAAEAEVAVDETQAAASETAPPLPPPPTRSDEFNWPAASSHVRIVTSKGDMIVELYGEKAPKTVINFLQYASDGHYDRTIFHRVVGGFVIQGGGYGVAFNERPTRPPIPYEGDNGLPNYRTTLAMARTRDPNSAAAQWYVNLNDNHETLDHFSNDLGPRYGYTVFGRVIEGMEVADAIGRLPTGAAGPFEAEVPVETVLVTGVEQVEAAAGN